MRDSLGDWESEKTYLGGRIYSHNTKFKEAGPLNKDSLEKINPKRTPENINF